MKLRLTITIEDPNRVREVISWYNDETLDQGTDYTNRYFIQGIE